MRALIHATRFSIVHVALGAILVAVVAMFGLLAGSTWLSTPACTGQQVRDGTVVIDGAAPLIPSPIGEIVRISAEQLDAAVAAYLELHPEKVDETLGWGDWSAIGGLIIAGLFGLDKKRDMTRTSRLVTFANATAAAFGSSGSADKVEKLLSEALPGKAKVTAEGVAEIVADAKVTTAETKADAKAAEDKA